MLTKRDILFLLNSIHPGPGYSDKPRVRKIQSKLSAMLEAASDPRPMLFDILDADDNHNIMGGSVAWDNGAFSFIVPEAIDGNDYPHHTQLEVGESMRVHAHASGMNQAAIIKRIR